MSTTGPLRRSSKKVLVAVVAVGTISLSFAGGVAGASAPAPATAHVSRAEHAKIAKALRLECHRTFRWLHREKRLTAHYDKRLKMLREAKSAAAAAGHQPRVNALKHDIAHVRSLRRKTLGEKVFGLEPAKGRALSGMCIALLRSAVADQRKHHKGHEARAKERAAKERAAKEREAKAAAARAAAAKAAAAKAAAAKAAAAKVATTTTTSPPKPTPTTTAPKPTPTTAPPPTSTTSAPPTTSTTVAPTTTTPSSTTPTTAATQG